MTPQNPQTVEASVERIEASLRTFLYGKGGRVASEALRILNFGPDPTPPAPTDKPSQGQGVDRLKCKACGDNPCRWIDLRREGEYAVVEYRVDGVVVGTIREPLSGNFSHGLHASLAEDDARKRHAPLNMPKDRSGLIARAVEAEDKNIGVAGWSCSQGQGGEGRVRWFRHRDGFGDPSLVLAVLRDGKMFARYSDGHEEPATGWDAAFAEQCKKSGLWIEEFFPDSPSTPTPEVQKPAWQARCSHPGCTNTVLNDGDKCRAHFVPQKPAEGQDIGPEWLPPGVDRIDDPHATFAGHWVSMQYKGWRSEVARLRQENQTLREQLKTMYTGQQLVDALRETMSKLPDWDHLNDTDFVAKRMIDKLSQSPRA